MADTKLPNRRQSSTTSSAEQLVLGLDGGGTKTLLALADRHGRIVAIHRGGGINPFGETKRASCAAGTASDPVAGTGTGEPTATRYAWSTRLAHLLAEAAPPQARGWQNQVVAAVAGLAGYGELPELSLAMEREIAALLAPRHGFPGSLIHTLRNDAQIAFDGAFLGGEGVLLLSGTGSLAWGMVSGAASGRGSDRPVHAEPVRAGGWGADFGDEGSAFWIGRRALSLTSQVLDGRLPAPAFAAGMLAAMGIAGATDPTVALLDWFHSRTDPRTEVAALARGVSALAESGDGTARGILDAAADALAELARAVSRRLGHSNGKVRTMPWSYAGGTFGSAILRHAMEQRLGPPQPPALPPVGGALWRAAALAGWLIDDAWLDTLRHTLTKAEMSASSCDPISGMMPAKTEAPAPRPLPDNGTRP